MTSSSIAPASSHAGVVGEARMWVTALLVGMMWLDVMYGSPVGAQPFARWLVALAGLAAELAFTVCEAAAAVASWRVLGRLVRWSELAPRLLVASSVETLAVSIAAGRAHLPRGWALALAGTRALEGAPAAGVSGPSHGLAAAFAAFGVLAIVRMVFSAALQARVARATFSAALLLVIVMWLVSRLAMWWTFDLLQGRSFQP